MPSIEWFANCFPNRHSDKPVVEVSVKFGPGEQPAFPQHSSDIVSLLRDGGLLGPDEEFPEFPVPKERRAWFTSLLVQTALLFERKAGHRVSYQSVSCYPEQDRCVALLEHEHCDVGMTAVKLAAELLTGKRRSLAGPFHAFSQFAAERLLPIDVEAIIAAAHRRDIPCVQLERQPYKRDDFTQLTGGDCIRSNGLLMLGHGEQQHVLDGTFCIDRSARLKGLLNSSARRRALLEKSGSPLLPPGDGRTADQEVFQLVTVNATVTAAVRQSEGAALPLDAVHSSLIELAVAINRELDYAPVLVTILAQGISKPLAQTGGGVVDFELAPVLDCLLQSDPGLIDSTAAEIIDWLFPEPACARMPVIAVTGTNGKTTTSRMISHILTGAGRKPGLVCTDGVFLNGRQVENEDQAADTGHLKVLTSKEVDVAVLEAHHVGIIYRGFAFRWCDIAVCLNVSEDHLGVADIKTVEQMAAVKQALPERARKAAVLNADDPHCVAMIGSLTAEKICLVSMSSTRESLEGLTGGRVAGFCVLEQEDGADCLVMYDEGRRLPVMPVDEIPATFGGLAKFNVSNAMHAVAAAWFAGIETGQIRAAMREFKMGYETTPGRLNVFDDLPFRVIMDFAHNPAGAREMAAFADQLDVPGRKVVAFAGSPDRKDETLRNIASELAGHFDFYFCKEHPSRHGEERRKVAPILKEGLLAAGVGEDQIALRTYGKEVIFEILAACQAGDLLVMLMGHVETHQLPGLIKEFAGGQD